jgi:hypothetical protein
LLSSSQETIPDARSARTSITCPNHRQRAR